MPPDDERFLGPCCRTGTSVRCRRGQQMATVGVKYDRDYRIIVRQSREFLACREIEYSCRLVDAARRHIAISGTERDRVNRLLVVEAVQALSAREVKNRDLVIDPAAREISPVRAYRDRVDQPFVL